MLGNFQQIIDKIKTKEELTVSIDSWKAAGKKIAFTNGCFDIIHRGHAEYLAKASELADVLIIGLNSDESVRRLKGENRPIQNEEDRAILLASFGFTAAIIIFEADTPYELIKFIQPDCLIKGADYKAEDIVGYDIVTQNGGKVLTVDLVAGRSTSNIIEKANIKL